MSMRMQIMKGGAAMGTESNKRRFFFVKGAGLLVLDDQLSWSGGTREQNQKQTRTLTFKFFEAD